MYCINPNCVMVNRGDKYLIKNNDTGKYYELSKPQFQFIKKIKNDENILNSLDSTIEIKFCEVLKKMGVIVDKDTFNVSSRKRFTFTDIFHFRFVILNPNKICDKLVTFFRSGVGLFFMLCLFMTVIVNVSYLFAGNSLDIFSHKGHMNVLLFLALMYSSTIILSIGHEFSHAVTCKLLGGNVDEMGFAFLYLSPCFYCNVSDSYLFKEKWKRILVPLIGIIYDIFSALTVALILRRYVVLDVIYIREYLKFSFLMLLFEINPLLKHDGYYVLTECVSIYNLRERGIIECKNLVNGESWFKLNKGYLLYGLLSIFFLAFHLLLLGRAIFNLIQICF